MKKIILVLTSIVVLAFLVIIFVPIIFKDDIQQLIKNGLDENVEAEVFFDADHFEFSMLKSFPNPTASLHQFGIVGGGIFENDTLLSVGSFNITIDLFSLFSDQYRIKSVGLESPKINIIALKDGRANYNIVPESEEVDTVSEEQDSPLNFQLSIDHWSVENGYVSYRDESMDFAMYIIGLNHEGSGDISLDNYNLKTKTKIDKTVVDFEGVKYLNKQSLFANLTLNIDMASSKYSFLQNEIRVNDFPLQFDGFVAMPGDDIEMDISFSSPESSIKSLYSLIPGVFTEGYEDIKAEGELSFGGFVKGVYNENSLPAYNITLSASEGTIAYPDLPTPISNINLSMNVNCEDGIIENTKIDLSRMHMDLGSNPIDISLLIKNLRDYDMNAKMKMDLNLADLNSIFPIEGLDMRGIFGLDMKASGVYDSIKNQLPAINAIASLKDGYIKSSEFPKALEGMSFSSEVDGSTGKMEDMKLVVNDFKMTMEEDELSANLIVKNFVDYQWDLQVSGGLDLAVISEVYPLEDMKYQGKLRADVQTKGKYSDVEAERYERFPTSGQMELTDFDFVSADLPQGMKISQSKVALDPKQILVKSFDGSIGHSDLKLNGIISNYINYIFNEDEVLTGKMSLSSQLMDLNEFMSEEEVSSESDQSVEDTVSMEAVEIPKNINFEFDAAIKRIIYDNLNLDNAKGRLVVKNGILDMHDLSFGMLGGNIVMNGQYDSRVPDQPSFDYDLDIKSLSIPKAFVNFSTVQTFAPMAQHLNGDFSTQFSLSGKLKNDMTPVYESINGKGLIQIAQAFVKESKLVSGLAGFMKSDAKSTQLSLKDVILKSSIENGRAYVAPFDVNLAGHKATLVGSIGIDGSLDYNVDTEIDAGAIGQQVNQLLANLKGEQSGNSSSKVNLKFNVGGTYENPKFDLAGSSMADGSGSSTSVEIKQEVKKEAEKQVEVVKVEAEEKLNEEATKVIDEGGKMVKQQADTVKKQIEKELGKEAEELIGEELDSTTEELKNTLKGLFKRKKKN